MVRIVLMCALVSVIFGQFVPTPIPAYCANDMNVRDIPPLSAEDQLKVTNLIQVQAVIRHGSRTPHAKYSCWKNYDISWNDCDVTELMVASNSYTSTYIPTNKIYRKLYDGSPNLLGGNCLTGQLMGHGYVQEYTLGNILANSYIGTSNIHLYNNNSWDSINSSRIYLRADDSTRTLMSGQLLLEAMFNNTNGLTINTISNFIPCHTGGYALDQLSPNSQVCPQLMPRLC